MDRAQIPRNDTQQSAGQEDNAALQAVYRTLYVHFWPILMGFTVLAAVLVPPPEATLELIKANKMEFHMKSILGFALSPAFLGCAALAVGGYIWGMSSSHPLHRASATEQMIALWHLTNAMWWSFGCDVLSGLFAVMPNMNILYVAIDSKHAGDVAKRAGLDVVYWVELFIHVPVSWWCFHRYVKQSKERRIVEAFLCGCQVVGCIAYYGSEILESIDRGTFKGGHWPWDYQLLFWLGVGFGLVWIIVPIALLKRTLLML